MRYLLEIKETSASKALIEHLKTLKYVKLKKANEEPGKDIVNAIRKSEKSKRIKWEDAKKQVEAWR